MTNESEEIKKLSQEIIQSLESNATNGISFYESIFLENEKKSISFEEYLQQLQKTLKKSNCQVSWNSDMLIVSCLDCQKSSKSCICVNCFLKGNHKGHKIILIHSISGCCDCGDPLSWSESGFCCDHSSPEPNPELTQLDKSTRIKTISICNSALHYSHKFAKTNRDFFNDIIDFLTKLASLGDAIRRCVSIAICESFDFIDLYTNSNNLRQYDYVKIYELISLISNDNVFRNYFTVTFYHNLPKFIRISQQLSNQYTNPKEPPLLSIFNLFELSFFGSTYEAISNLVHESKIDWFTILNESLHLHFNFEENQMARSYFTRSSRFKSFYRLYSLFKSAIKNFGGKNSKVIEIIENFVEKNIGNEFSFPFVRIFGDKVDDENETQLAVFDINFDLRRVLTKIINNEIFTTKPLFVLKKFFDSDTFKKIDKNVNDYQIYFHSVLSKNVQFTQFFSMHLYAFHCLNLKENKTLIEYISEVTDNVELFIKRWAVLPLRWIVASLLNDFDFFVRNTDDTIITFSSLKYKRNIKHSFTQIFTLIQSLLKVTKNVDDFFLIVISTFDLTVIEEKNDTNFDGNEKRIILFNIFHFICCLIFDTLCSSRNFFMMRRFYVISCLMKNNMTIEKINETWYKNIMHDDKFLDDLKSVTSRETTKKGLEFHLTDNSEWHPILPHLKLSEIIPLIQAFITKNPDSLINFPDIPNGSEYLLFSPTLWALEYCILDNKECKDFQIIHQLIFNVLIITANNCESFYKDKKMSSNEDDSILHVDEFKELIEALKKLTFEQFIKKKIDFNMNHEDDGKSMIDLLSSLGNVGLTILKRMNISNIDKSSSEDNLQIQKKNKERANKIKAQMMNNFIQRQKTFQSTVSQDQEECEKVPKIECGICHIENENDCFVYPALIYKSSLSSYIKWRFCDSKNDLTNIPENFESFNSVHICMHPIHSRCIQNKENYFCPADRCKRNSTLPIIEGIFDCNSISNEVILNEISSFVKNAYDNDINLAVFSLASEIEVLEVRHRSNPNCLDNKIVAATLRNIYLCIWHEFHLNIENFLENEELKRRRNEILKKIENKTWNEYKNQFKNLPEIDENISNELNLNKICEILFPSKEIEIENKKIHHLSPLMKYILFSMNLKDNELLNMTSFIKGKLLSSKFNEIQSNDENDSIFNDFDIINDLSSDYQKLQFLRCAAIFDYFARNQNIIQKVENKNDEFIDWDDILNSSFLHNFYKINQVNNNNNLDDYVLPMFSFCNVPDNFLDFIYPPFSLPILSSDKEKAICLLTGKVVSLVDQNPENIMNYVNNTFCKSFSIFLSLNGSKLSEVFVMIHHPSFKRISLKSFYTNKFDETDIGIKKGFLLFLNESKQEEIIDNFLSGNWLNSISF